MAPHDEFALSVSAAGRSPRWEQPLISVVMPCLNEADGVGRCVEKALTALRQMNIPGEVIVVDNGSTDGSPELAAKAGARVVHGATRQQ